jgi:hypothetical protein
MLVVEGNHGLEGFQKRIICADYPVNYSMDDPVDYPVENNRLIFAETEISSQQITLELEQIVTNGLLTQSSL